MSDEAGGSCRSLNNDTMRLNTSDVTSGTYVHVNCVQGYQLSTIHVTPSPQQQQQDVFHCLNSLWNPYTPRCVESDDPGVPVGIVVGCTIGGVLCLIVVLIAAYIMCRTRDENETEKQNDLLNKAKILHLNMFMTSFQQDNVGMPAVTGENDLDLRGVASYDQPVTSYDQPVMSYGAMDTGAKPYRSSGSVFGGDDDDECMRKPNSKC